MHLPLNFALLDSGWNAISLQAAIAAYFNALPQGAWPDFVIGAHDKHRVASKVGQAQARILAMLLMTIRGTPFLFAGDEIGSEQVPIPLDRVQDPFERLMKGFSLGRDPERAPLRWDDTDGGGVTTGEPWLPLSRDRTRNINSRRHNRKSHLNLYREQSPCDVRKLAFGRRVSTTTRAERCLLVRAQDERHGNPHWPQYFGRTTVLGVARLRRPIVIDRAGLQAGKGNRANPPEAE
ncbi:alpha-amylase family glycosyl hydrolase [Bradyrhizobium pachyrhizi]|uniref:alpha-amylase family glycosyl hydrolase n=1 Tax=Bradyrhizobium pachyrhizi TaxID=280333 RepID=UPI003D361D9C